MLMRMHARSARAQDATRGWARLTLLELIRGRLILPDLAATEKRGAILELVDFMHAQGDVARDAKAPVLKAVFGREDFMSTGMEHGMEASYVRLETLI